MLTRLRKNTFGAASVSAVLATMMLGLVDPTARAVAADYSQVQARMLARLGQFEPRLSLTPQQKEQFNLLIKASVEHRISILQKHGVEPGSKNALSALQAAEPAIEEEQAALRAKLANILSQDQMKTFDEIGAEMRKALSTELSGS